MAFFSFLYLSFNNNIRINWRPWTMHHSFLAPFKWPCHLGLSPAHKQAEHIFQVARPPGKRSRWQGHQGLKSNRIYEICSREPTQHLQDLPCLLKNLETSLHQLFYLTLFFIPRIPLCPCWFAFSVLLFLLLSSHRLPGPYCIAVP